MKDEEKIVVTTGGSLDEVPKVSCAQCNNETKHNILASVELAGSHPAIDWKDNYQIIQCRGCETISFRKVHTNSEDWDGYYLPDGSTEYEYVEHIELFPSREQHRQAINDADQLPTKIRLIYLETIESISAGQPVLAGVGIRAIVETICKDANANGKDLKNKIDNLVTIGKLTPGGAETLHKLRVLGNAAAHDVVPHSAEQLGLGMDVLEHLLADLYILPGKVTNVFGAPNRVTGGL